MDFFLSVVWCIASVVWMFLLIWYDAVKLRWRRVAAENSVSGQGRRAWIIKSLFPN